MSEWDGYAVFDDDWGDAASFEPAGTTYHWEPTNNPNVPGQTQMVEDKRPAAYLSGHLQTPVSRVGSAGRAVMQGFTWTAADELAAAAEAAGSYTAERLDNMLNSGQQIKELPYSSYYNNALAENNQLLRDDLEYNPSAAIGGNIAGSLLSGSMLKTGVTKVAPALGGYLGGAKTWLGARGRDALVSAPAGAITGYNSADPTVGDSRENSALGGALIGSILGPAAGWAFGRKIPGQTLDDLAPLGQDLTKLGDELGYGIRGAENAAWRIKNDAYDAWDAISSETSAPSRMIDTLANKMTKLLKDNYDSDLAPARKDAERYIEQIRPVLNPRETTKINKLQAEKETLRQEILSANKEVKFNERMINKGVDPFFKSGTGRNFDVEEAPGIVEDLLLKNRQQADGVLQRNGNRMKEIDLQLKDIGDEISNRPVTLDKIENLRKKLNRLAQVSSGNNAKSTKMLVSDLNGQIDDHLDNLLQKGLIEGDQSALVVINDARSKNSYYMQKFAGKDANAVIKKYVDEAGGIDAVSPEKLLDMMTNVGQTGLNNVRAAKDVLGSQAKPVLKSGFINRLKNNATEADDLGNILVRPKLLAKNIDNFLDNNPTLAKEIFEPGELVSLRQLSTAAKQKGKSPGFLGRLTNKIRSNPVIPWAEKASIKLEDINTGSAKSLYNRLPANPTVPATIYLSQQRN